MSEGQTWDPDRYARNARFVADLGMPVVELLAPQPGERILDLGCGDGALTAKLAAMGCDVVGIDASEQQIEAAQARGLDVRVMPGEALAFDREFDAVFSNAALHWMKQRDAVIAGVARALRPSGRFVGEFGGFGNVHAVQSALEQTLVKRGIDPKPLNPWYFPSVEEYRGKLEAHGFAVDTIFLFDRPTELPGEMTDWLETFAEPFTAALPDADRTAFRREVQEALRSKLLGSDGKWRRRLRAAAIRRPS